MILKGTFTSVWDGGEEITTPATLNTETGEVTAVAVEGGDVDILFTEFFTDEDEIDYEICPECHNFILKSAMKEGIGKTLDEVQICSDPECENN